MLLQINRCVDYPHMPMGKVWNVDISVTVFLFVCCTITDFSDEDKPSSVKFCTVVYGRPGQVIFHFGELCSPISPKSDGTATYPEVKFMVEELP